LLTPLGHHIIVISEQVKRNIINYFHIPACRVTVIPNATRTDVVREDEDALRAFDEKWSIPPGSQVVACVAMLVEVKAHDILLSAWKQVMRHFPQAVLILAGDGPLKEHLQAQCVQIEATQGVRFLGFVDNISIVYSRASFVVLPSRSEGLPISILEAFSYGLPAVATAVSGTPEIVIPEKTGLLVEPENPEQLSQSIMRLLSDSQLRRRLGQAGRQLVVEKYSSGVRELAIGNYFRTLT
jgi:glycosyltransferase involved in cell wall biosynthesis